MFRLLSVEGGLINFEVLDLLGGVGHCYAWHVRVPFGNVLFLISNN